MKPPERPSASAPGVPTTGRAIGFERGVVTLVGLIIAVAGITALIVGTGLFGIFRAQRPILDPLVLWLMLHYPIPSIVAAVVVGIVLVAVGGWWISRALRPETRPDMRLRTESPGDVTVESNALSEAIRTDAESLGGVTRARVRMTGTTQRPTLRMTLSLQEGTNVRQVWEDLDHLVLSRARAAMEIDAIPTAIRLVLDRAPKQRVR